VIEVDGAQVGIYSLSSYDETFDAAAMMDELQAAGRVFHAKFI